MTKTFSTWKPGARLTGFSIQSGAFRGIGHAQPALVEVLLAIEIHQNRPCFGVLDQRHAKGRGNAFGGDIVVGRPDSAGGEDVVELGPDSLTVATITSWISGITRASSMRMPSAFRDSPRKARLASFGAA